MKEELVTLKTAKLAKEKGFDEESRCGYKENGDLMTIDRSEESFFAGASRSYRNSELPSYNKTFHDDWICICTASTQSELCKWLRELHKTDITVITNWERGVRYYRVGLSYVKDDKVEIWFSKDGIVLIDYSSYEEALESGLSQALSTIQ